MDERELIARAARERAEAEAMAEAVVAAENLGRMVGAYWRGLVEAGVGKTSAAALADRYREALVAHVRGMGP